MWPERVLWPVACSSQFVADSGMDRCHRKDLSRDVVG
jgi:hypothetical protein